MAYIEVKNLILNNNTINLSFDKEIVGIYGDNQELIKEFMLIISGINKNNNTCFYKDEDLFDNPKFFKNRLFLDFLEVYTNTLKKEFIAENFLNRFEREFNQDKFKKLIKDLHLRKETNIDVAYTFTKTGNTLVNYSLVECLNIYNIIISHPTVSLDTKERIEMVVNGLTNKEKYDNVILNLDNVGYFKGKLDKIVFFTKDNKVIECSGKDTLLLIEDNIHLRNVISYAKDNYVIAYNDYTKEELKHFNKVKIKYKEISVYDIEKYKEEKL